VQAPKGCVDVQETHTTVAPSGCGAWGSQNRRHKRSAIVPISPKDDGRFWGQSPPVGVVADQRHFEARDREKNGVGRLRSSQTGLTYLDEHKR